MILGYPLLFISVSFNKKYYNAQGGQPRVSGVGAGSDSHLNGAHQQQPSHGMSIDHNNLFACISGLRSTSFTSLF